MFRGLLATLIKRVRNDLAVQAQLLQQEKLGIRDRIINSLAEGVVTVGSAGQVQSCSRVAERLLGRHEGELYGTDCRGLFPVEITGPGGPLEAALHQGTVAAAVRAELPLAAGPGLAVLFTVSPLRNSREEIIGAVVAFVDDSENLALRKELKRQYSFGDIVGRSKAMQELFRMVRDTAAADITVLLAGPSGTGKELVARALHNSGPRRDQPFVAVNCAALPATLLEGELFGHCRGAFTGAHQDHAGKFEQAGGGTIFLDEIGELPLPLQGKLLRAVEEKQFCPLGGNTVKRVRARIITASNQDLGAMVARGAPPALKTAAF